MPVTRSILLALLSYLVVAPAAAAQVDEVRFDNGDVTLAASLYLPDAEAPLPAVVMIQGSGTSSRNNDWARAFAEALSARGYAVLFPDKRGSGQSGGDWQTVGFELLARDAIAGAELVRRNPAIDASRVGYLGLSQGGHIVPLAARLDPRSAFAISVVGSLVTMEQQLLDELELAYVAYGMDAATIEYLQEMARYSLDFIKTGDGWERYITRHREISAGPLSVATETWPTDQDDLYWEFWRQVWDYDPRPHWQYLAEQRDLPSLMIFGTGDRNVRVDRSLEIASELAAHPNFRVCVYEGGGHALWGQERGELRADMLQDLDHWLAAALVR
jgi:dipeptidyl aminopeptidase/acylaminoacyl peptidase